MRRIDEIILHCTGTKAGQVVEQGADVMLIDIYKNSTYKNDLVIDGVDNSFYYNPQLKGICVMIESDSYITISRNYWENGQGKNGLLSWLQKNEDDLLSATRPRRQFNDTTNIQNILISL